MTSTQTVRVPVADLRSAVLSRVSGTDADLMVEFDTRYATASAYVVPNRCSPIDVVHRIPLMDMFEEVTMEMLTVQPPISDADAWAVLEHDPTSPNPGKPVSDEFKERVNAVVRRSEETVWSVYEPKLRDGLTYEDSGGETVQVEFEYADTEEIDEVPEGVRESRED